jgi:O-antigen ligase
MIEGALLTAILWFGIVTLLAAEHLRWLLTAFELALFALGAALILRRRLAIRPHPIAIILAVAAVWALMQVWLGISVDPQRTLQAALGWAVNCAAFSVTLAICKRDHIRRRFLTAQVLFALALSVASVIGLYTVSMLGPFAYKNQFAAYLESVIGIAIMMSLESLRRGRGPGRVPSAEWAPAAGWVPAAVWMLVAGTMFASVVAAASRAGSILCLALLIALPVVALFRGRISGRDFARIAGLVLVSGVVLVMVAGWETTWQRLQESNPYSIRADLLRSSIAMIRDRPLIGFGLGAWPSAYPGYARYDDGRFVNQAHNDWAQWAAEGGIPFLMLMLAVLALLLRPAFVSLWGLGLMAVFVHAWIDYPFEQRPALAAFLFAMAGALAAEVSLNEGSRTEAIASPARYRPGESSPA